MDYIYLFAKKNEIDLIELDYWLENKVAKQFYEKHNFVVYREFAYKQL
ncbi:hypothetical protein [Bacillus solimangrovi]